ESVKLFVVVAELTLQPPPAPAKTALKNGLIPGATVSPVSVELKSTVPLACANVPACALNDPPTARVPEARIIGPPASVRSSSRVKLSSAKVNVPPPWKSTPYRSELEARTNAPEDVAILITLVL